MRKADRWHEQGSSVNDGSEVGEGLPVTGALSPSGGSGRQYPQHSEEVAVELSISTKTVEAHRTSLMRKLGVRKATELVRYALRHGLIEP